MRQLASFTGRGMQGDEEGPHLCPHLKVCFKHTQVEHRVWCTAWQRVRTHTTTRARCAPEPWAGGQQQAGCPRLAAKGARVRSACCAQRVLHTCCQASWFIPSLFSSIATFPKKEAHRGACTQMGRGRAGGGLHGGVGPHARRVHAVVGRLCVGVADEGGGAQAACRVLSTGGGACAGRACAHVCVCVCARARVCVCVCVCSGMSNPVCVSERTHTSVGSFPRVHSLWLLFSFAGSCRRTRGGINRTQGNVRVA